jgi:DNA modification methylase
MTVEDFSTENPFYCRDAGEQFLGKESVDLFIGHPPYFMAEPILNGGDPRKQMQNSGTLEKYHKKLLSSFLHMEHALKPDGHMFIAIDNAPVGLSALPVILNNTKLKLQDIRMWDYFPAERGASGTVVFIHLTKKDWYPEKSTPRGAFVLTNSWEEAYEELKDYNQEYSTVGAAPTGIYRDMIQDFSKEGDVVCDLFAGCGTVQVVALEYGRKFIYNDVSEDKVITAKKRIEDYLLTKGASSNAK